MTAPIHKPTIEPRLNRRITVLHSKNRDRPTRIAADLFRQATRLLAGSAVREGVRTLIAWVIDAIASWPG